MIIDVILALVLVWAVFQGLKRGLIDQIAMLLGLWFGVWLSFTFSEALIEWIDIEMSNSVIFVILFAVGIGMALLCSFVARKLAKKIGLGIVDKIGGVLFSLVSYTLLLSLLLGIFRDVNARMEFIDDNEFNKSILIEPIEKVADVVFPYVKEVKDLAVESFD